MEIFSKIDTYYVQMQCSKCKVAHLVHNGQTIAGKDQAATSYRHICQNPACLFSTYLRGITYPQIRQVAETEPLNPQPDFGQVEHHISRV